MDRPDLSGVCGIGSLVRLGGRFREAQQKRALPSGSQRFFGPLFRLTRIRSATPTGSERQSEAESLSHGRVLSEQRVGVSCIAWLDVGRVLRYRASLYVSGGFAPFSG
jgi:hypothetical protein